MRSELCNQLIDYFNQHLSLEEKMTFEKHLETCDECQSELRELEELTSDLTFLVSEEPVPSGMKDRVLSKVFEDEVSRENKTEKKNEDILTKKKRNKWAIPVLAAGLSLSVIGNGYLITKINSFNEPSEVTQSLSLQPASQEFNGYANGYIIEEAQFSQVIIQGSELPATTGQEVYQIWLIKGDQPIPAGSFTSSNGDNSSIFKIDKSEKWDTVAITLEPNAGNRLPQGEIILSAQVSS